MRRKHRITTTWYTKKDVPCKLCVTRYSCGTFYVNFYNKGRKVMSKAARIRRTDVDRFVLLGWCRV